MAKTGTRRQPRITDELRQCGRGHEHVINELVQQTIEDKFIAFEHLHIFCWRIDYDTENTKICQELLHSTEFLMFWLVHACWDFHAQTIDRFLKFDVSKMRTRPDNFWYWPQIASVIAFLFQMIRQFLSPHFSDMRIHSNKYMLVFASKMCQSLIFIFRDSRNLSNLISRRKPEWD